MGMKLTYCSFADDERCRGVVILDGYLDPVMAALQARFLGINPGGQLLVFEIPEDLEGIDVYFANRNRLLTADEARTLFDGMTLSEWEGQLN